MTGGLLSNEQIVELVTVDHSIVIEPFDQRKLRGAHYPLSVARVRGPGVVDAGGQRQFDILSEISQGSTEYQFRPGEYVICEVAEHVALRPGYVGKFEPTSYFVEAGFGFTSGKLDAGYGELVNLRQSIVFGVANLLSIPNVFDFSRPIAHMCVFDVRGGVAQSESSTHFSDLEIDRFMRRSSRYERAKDDGPFYEDE